MTYFVQTFEPQFNIETQNRDASYCLIESFTLMHKIVLYRQINNLIQFHLIHIRRFLRLIIRMLIAKGIYKE